MRSQADIEQMYCELLTDDLSYRQDSFVYGFLLGKIEALRWVLSEVSTDMLRERHFGDRAGSNPPS